MKYIVPLVLLVYFVQAEMAKADSCVVLSAKTILNTCAVCKDVSLREMRAHDNRATGLFTGATHALRLQPGEKAALPGTDLWSINGLAACV